MKEKPQKHNESKSHGAGPLGSPFDKKDNKPKLCSIQSGHYKESKPVEGMTIGEIRKTYGAEFDLDKSAVAVVNRKEVKDDYKLGAGESLLFIHKTGEKGAKHS